MLQMLPFCFDEVLQTVCFMHRVFLSPGSRVSDRPPWPDTDKDPGLLIWVDYSIYVCTVIHDMVERPWVARAHRCGETNYPFLLEATGFLAAGETGAAQVQVQVQGRKYS